MTPETQFAKGHIPWNKGLKGFVHKGSFKKGHSQSNTGRTHFQKGLIPWSKLNPELMPEPKNKGRESAYTQKEIKNTELSLSRVQAA